MSWMHKMQLFVLCDIDTCRWSGSSYEDDLPNPSSIDTELHCWTVKWKGKLDEDGDLGFGWYWWWFFPNIKQIFFIASTLSVTSAECERSVSRLQYLKTYLRSTMLEEYLNGLALMYVHRDTPCSAEAVVDEFARLRPRRLKLANPFELWSVKLEYVYFTLLLIPFILWFVYC